VEEIPYGQPNLLARLLEAATYPRWVMVPEAKKFTVHIDRDPTVVLHRHDRPVTILGGVGIAG
jgi:hypothetical protein